MAFALFPLLQGVVASQPTRVRSRHAFSRSVQRSPDRQEDETGTWSLMTLRWALRKTDLPHIGAETIRQVLHTSGYRFQQNRTWCRTGYALRVRKSGTVTVHDEQTLEKKRFIELACEQAEAAGIVQ